MKDGDGEDIGILKTNMFQSEVEKEWKEYWKNSESEDMGVDEFCTETQAKYPKLTFERIFLDADIYA